MTRTEESFKVHFHITQTAAMRLLPRYSYGSRILFNTYFNFHNPSVVHIDNRPQSVKIEHALCPPWQVYEPRTYQGGVHLTMTKLRYFFGYLSTLDLEPKSIASMVGDYIEAVAMGWITRDAAPVHTPPSYDPVPASVIRAAWEMAKNPKRGNRKRTPKVFFGHLSKIPNQPILRCDLCTHLIPQVNGRRHMQTSHPDHYAVIIREMLAQKGL